MDSGVTVPSASICLNPVMATVAAGKRHKKTPHPLAGVDRRGGQPAQQAHQLLVLRPHHVQLMLHAAQVGGSGDTVLGLGRVRGRASLRPVSLAGEVVWLGGA